MEKLYGYLIIEKSSGRCFQSIISPVPDFALDNELDYSLQVDPEGIKEYLNKFYINGVWFWREWLDVDENGNPVEGSAHIDHLWYPGEGDE